MPIVTKIAEAIYIKIGNSVFKCVEPGDDLFSVVVDYTLYGLSEIDMWSEAATEDELKSELKNFFEKNRIG